MRRKWICLSKQLPLKINNHQAFWFKRNALSTILVIIRRWAPTFSTDDWKLNNFNWIHLILIHFDFNFESSYFYGENWQKLNEDKRQLKLIQAKVYSTLNENDKELVSGLSLEIQRNIIKNILKSFIDVSFPNEQKTNTNDKCIRLWLFK